MRYFAFSSTFLVALLVSFSSFFLQSEVVNAEDCFLSDNPCCAEQYDVEDLEDRIRCTSGGSDPCGACCEEDEEVEA